MCATQGLIPRAHDYLVHQTHIGFQREASTVPKSPRATVGAPDDDLIDQTIQPALDHIEYTPVAHSCAKETAQLATGEQW